MVYLINKKVIEESQICLYLENQIVNHFLYVITNMKFPSGNPGGKLFPRKKYKKVNLYT